jgi:tRNA A37 threonylcarbamoyladenosine synthetase subunit TsaC/SUA5/YrdC
MPDHKTILELIKKCGPVVATSANIAGERPALSAKEVKLDVDCILSGKVKTGKASRVIDTTSKIKILRT